jgi:ubiquitin carboxyl-terminal hydrolase 10
LLATEPIVFPREQPSESLPVQNEPPPTEDEAVQQEQDKPQHDSMPTPTQSATPLASEPASDAPSDAGSTQPTTPSSAFAPFEEKIQRTPTQPKAHRATKSVVPAVPILPQSPSAAKRPHRDSVVSTHSKASNSPAPMVDSEAPVPAASSTGEDASSVSDATPTPVAAVVSAPGPPKSWADLVRTKAAASAPVQAAVHMPNGASGGKTETLSDVLNDISVTENEPASKINLLEPRGLVNTGNMCYMNSVSQTLLENLPLANRNRFFKF